ncbi:MAG TPA: hypothetical protein VKJ65_00295, partial [Phycisphaerae bacterium]|nr:hypothetical protein [Phycisphaerae bacterium]
MTKKDINEMLILPFCMFVIIAVLAFGICFISRDAKVDLVSGQQSFERFADKVEGGKEQLTTERAMAIMRAKQVAIDSYLKAFIMERWLV